MNLYNSTTYASGEPITSASQDDIVINGFGLQNEYIKTSFISEGNIVDFTSFNHPKSNGRGLLGYYMRGKNIGLKISVRGDNIADFLERLDNLRKNLFRQEVFLDVKNNGVVRRIKVNCISAPKNFEHYNITFLKVDITLETLEPFFYEIGNQTSTFSGKTASFDEYIVNKGTAESEPIIYLNFKTGLSGVNAISVTIGDKTIALSDTISDNDAVVIDCEKKTVKINDVLADDLGEFPFLDIDGNAINFTINGTFDVDINVINKINYV